MRFSTYVMLGAMAYGAYRAYQEMRDRGSNELAKSQVAGGI